MGNFSIGYIFSYKKLRIIPVIGVGYSNRIYEDPILFDGYYLAKEKGKLNFGAVLVCPISPILDITVGGGNFEIAKFGINMKVFEMSSKSKR